MSGVSDKARFYLEQSVPQLQEFEQKKIFTKDEIRDLTKKRSTFEHKVLARGSTPLDFARYAVWETNLEQLRQKRCKRMRIKDNLRYAGPARIFQILDRGTKKHPGDVALWMSYLESARKAKAVKKFNTVLTSAIRLHPTKPELWLYAARWTLETEADINGARSYMQRGTRFCIQSKDVWLEYAKLEMIYLAKIAMRRKILGLEKENATTELIEAQAEGSLSDTEDMIRFSEPTTHTMNSSMIEKIGVDDEAAKDPLDTPALNGAIPLAIYDSATKQPFFCGPAAEAFYNMFSVFREVKSQPKILQHVLDSAMAAFPTDPATLSCYIHHPIILIKSSSPEFPVGLASSLERLTEALAKTKDKEGLGKRVNMWIEPILAEEGLDTGVRTVLEHMVRRLG